MRRLLPLAFWSATAFALVMALLPQPPDIPGQPPDKIQHMVAFFTLAVLGSLAFPRIPPVRLALGLAAFGALIEVLQLIPALGRDAELLDWVADTGAVLVGLGVARLALRLRAP